MTNFSLEVLLRWASTEECPCQLEWSFLSSQFPKFTTSHVLVGEDAADVSFGGGLSWAVEIFNLFHPPKPSALDTQEQPALTPRRSARLAGQRTQQVISSQEIRGCASPTTSPGADPESYVGAAEPLSPLFPPLFPLSPPSFGYQHSSVSLEHTSWAALQGASGASLPRPQEGFSPSLHDSTRARTFPNPGSEDEFRDDIDQPNSPTSLTTAPTRQTTPGWDFDMADTNSREHGRMKVHTPLNTLSQRRQDAEMVFASTGDRSAMFAVLNSAAQDSEAWHPSGLARF